jgi:integral membrane sensor domain MASE1
VTARPDWPERLLVMADTMVQRAGASHSTPAVRQSLELKKLRETIARDLLGGAVSGPRLDNLVCDGFLPLVAARTGHDLLAVWSHWFLGDVPAPVRTALPRLGLAGGRAQPFCHGRAQGLLGWILAREARASC